LVGPVRLAVGVQARVVSVAVEVFGRDERLLPDLLHLVIREQEPARRGLRDDDSGRHLLQHRLQPPPRGPEFLKQRLALLLGPLPLNNLVLQLGLLAYGLRGAGSLTISGHVHRVAEGGDREPDAEVGRHRDRVFRDDREPRREEGPARGEVAERQGEQHRPASPVTRPRASGRRRTSGRGAREEVPVPHDGGE
jgi:hypothetical protein